MVASVGTRKRQFQQQGYLATRTLNAGYTRDLGLSKNVTASLTYTAGTAQVSGANGTFSAFVVGDQVQSSGTNLNDGVFLVTGIDATNSAYLGLSPAPAGEGPITATIRTA